jgi:hypothetical protein
MCVTCSRQVRPQPQVKYGFQIRVLLVLPCACGTSLRVPTRASLADLVLTFQNRDILHFKTR